MSEHTEGPSCKVCGVPLYIGCEHSKAQNDAVPRDIDAEYELKRKTEREKKADMLREELTEALAALDRAKEEMVANNLDASWQSMEEVENKASTLRVGAERLRIELRLQAEQQKS